MSNDSAFHLFVCPHCQGSILVLHGELNCRIFRHGVYRANSEPIPPHSIKAECDRLVQENLIEGCGKPFHIVESPSGLVAEACEYI